MCTCNLTDMEAYMYQKFLLFLNLEIIMPDFLILVIAIFFKNYFDTFKTQIIIIQSQNISTDFPLVITLRRITYIGLTKICTMYMYLLNIYCTNNCHH